METEAAKVSWSRFLSTTPRTRERYMSLVVNCKFRLRGCALTVLEPTKSFSFHPNRGSVLSQLCAAQVSIFHRRRNFKMTTMARKRRTLWSCSVHFSASRPELKQTVVALTLVEFWPTSNRDLTRITDEVKD